MLSRLQNKIIFENKTDYPVEVLAQGLETTVYHLLLEYTIENMLEGVKLAQVAVYGC